LVFIVGDDRQFVHASQTLYPFPSSRPILSLNRMNVVTYFHSPCGFAEWSHAESAA
jgi:hypothetical protein